MCTALSINGAACANGAGSRQVQVDGGDLRVHALKSGIFGNERNIMSCPQAIATRSLDETVQQPVTEGKIPPLIVVASITPAWTARTSTCRQSISSAIPTRTLSGMSGWSWIRTPRTPKQRG